MTDHELLFPFPSPPLASNHRMHWAQRASITQRVRMTTKVLARNIGPLGKCEVTLYWHVNTNHRRDADNIVPTLKAMCDGLVDAGIVVDDTPDLMVKHMPIIVPGTRTSCPTAHMRLVVRELSPLGVAA